MTTLTFFTLGLLVSVLTVFASPLALREAVHAPAGMVRMPFSIQRRHGGLAKRQTVASSISNELALNCYTIGVTVGDPPQSISLELDTGSSDTWMYGPDTCAAEGNEGPSGPGQPQQGPAPPPQAAGCGGGFDPSLSSTIQYPNITQNNFSVEYEDGSYAEGYYIKDQLQIGGVSVSGQIMAIATEAYGVITRGILGLGMQSQQEITMSGFAGYPTILDNMLSQGLIDVRAYSVFLDDLESNTGSIIFGGEDLSKYKAPLTAFPIQNLTSFLTGLAIPLASIGVTDDSGNEIFYTSAEGSLPSSAILDTGTTLTYLPPDIFNDLKAHFGVVGPSNNLGGPQYFLPCDLGQGQVDFVFGNSSVGGLSAVISVDYSELTLEQQGTQSSSDPADCIFGFAPSGSGFVSLGDTFLRSAYVIYNFDSLEISIAQSNPAGVGSDLVAFIGSGNLTTSLKRRRQMGR